VTSNYELFTQQTGQPSAQFLSAMFSPVLHYAIFISLPCDRIRSIPSAPCTLHSISCRLPCLRVSIGQHPVYLLPCSQVSIGHLPFYLLPCSQVSKSQHPAYLLPCLRLSKSQHPVSAWNFL
jgi:hypothetical protein